MRTSPIAVAIVAALGGVDMAAAQTEPLRLVTEVAAPFPDPESPVAGSMGAPSALIVSNSTATWSYDSTTDVVTGSGNFKHQSQVSPAVPGQVFTRDVVDLAYGGGLTSTAGATSFSCVDGSFSNAVGASFCGNYNFGANFINESTNSYGPGLAFSQTIAGDDVSIGAQQSIDEYDGSTTTVTPTQVIVDNLDMPVTPSSGQKLTYRRLGDAVDDLPGGAAGYGVLINSVGNVLDIGANDIRWPTPMGGGNQTVTGPATGSAGGTFVINSDPDITNVTVTYTPLNGFSGQETWTYTVTDTSGDAVTDNWMDSGTVTIDVSSAGAGDDTATVSRLREALPIPTGVNDLGFTDPSTVIIETPPMSGNVTINNSPGQTSAITITYTSTAALGTAGPINDSFVYRVTDAAMLTDTATVNVTVNNAVPVAGDLAGMSAVTLDTVGASPTTVSTNIDVGTGGDIAGNSGGDAPTTVTTGASNDVTTSVSGTTITITAVAFTSAGDAFGYTTTDADTETAMGTINVVIPDATPTVQDATETVNIGNMMTVSVPILPGNGAPAEHMATVSMPQFGAVTNVAVNAGGTAITFDYQATGPGNDALTVQLTDGDGSVDSGTATITVPNLIPMVQDVSVTAVSGSVTTVTVPTQLGDGTPAQHAAEVLGAQLGTVSNVVLNATGTEISFTYAADGGSGTDALTVQLTDLNGDVGTGTATITIPNQMPQVSNTTQTISFGGATAVAVATQPGDGMPTLHVISVSGEQWGDVSDIELNTTGTEITFNYTPRGFEATDTLTVQLTDLDGDAASGTATLTITGLAVTNPPQDTLPGKTSALGPLSLGALLASLPLMRNRRRKR